MSSSIKTAQFKRAVGIVPIERLAVHFLWVVDLWITVIEKCHMGGLLAGHAFANIAMTDVIVDEFGCGFDVDVVAPT
ncbi:MULTISPECIES: hypothetical protein [Falsihalocynthiibacter]|uniref:hypothetical protein n=1 Tax=Falsihalocynthiibacter TaxID=2854182 RepID=UPI0030012BCA